MSLEKWRDSVIIDLTQGSDEWLEWRKTKVTASEIPAILGKSPWVTKLELWKRKLGFIPEQPCNSSMQRGTELEPIVRALVNKQMGRKFEPVVVQHWEHSWAAASLDGFDGSEILEIKCPSKKDMITAKNNRIPKKYIPQIMWQMWCANVKKAYYASYDDDNLYIVEQDFDQEYIDSIFQIVKQFYMCLENMEEPS